MTNKLVAGIVTYNPDVENVIQTIRSIEDVVERVIVVDNGSKNSTELINRLSEFDNICIITNLENAGIAKALNQIMLQADLLEAKWVLSLDQDSKPDKKMIIALLDGVSLANVGIICPQIFDINSGEYTLKQHKTICSDNHDFAEVDKSITSGAITNIDAWKAAGRYDEFLFIDMVDFDFCKRVKSCGFRIIERNNAVLYHQIGHTIYHRFLWNKIGVMNHNPLRKYYMVRNRIYCKYKYDGCFGFRNVVGIIKTIIIVILYEKEKGAKIKSILFGIKDGIKAGRLVKETSH